MFIKGDFMTEKIKLRSEIDDKYKWDLTTIYQNEEKWQKAIDSLGFDVTHLSRTMGRA